jgi:hypothetical protein
MPTSVTLPQGGFEAELTVGGHVLVLRAVHTAVGPVANVFDATTQKWKEQKCTADIDEAKAVAEAAAKVIARALLKHAGSKEDVPHIVWQPL